MQKHISIIAGVQIPNRGLGFGGDLLHKIPADMQRFKELTEGNIVIMGRSTWESIPAKYRPLPNRHNIVLTRDESYVAPGASICGSLPEALEKSKEMEGDVFLIGGARVYAEGMEYADTLYLTEFFDHKEADTFFPEYSNFGEEVSREECMSESGVRFDFVEYRKVK